MFAKSKSTRQVSFKTRFVFGLDAALALVPKLTRYAATFGMALALTQQLAFAAQGDPGGALTNVGKAVLTAIFAIAGVAAAIVMSAIGLRLLIGAGTGSPYATSQSVLSFLAAGCGLLLALAGPTIAGMLIDAAASAGATSTDIKIPVVSGPSGGAAPTAIP
jgi:hypothetical protein